MEDKSLKYSVIGFFVVVILLILAFDGNAATYDTGLTLGSSAGVTNHQGGFINVSGNPITIEYIVKDASDTSTHCYIYNGSGIQVKNATYSGNVCNVGNFTLNASSKYCITGGKGAASYTLKYNNAAGGTFPYQFPELNISAGCYIQTVPPLETIFYSYTQFYHVDYFTAYNYSAPAVTPETYGVQLSSTPDINTTVFNVHITATVNSSENMSDENNGFVTLHWLPNSTLNGACSIFENGACSTKNNYTLWNLTKQNNTLFNLTLSDTEIFPAYYPWYRSIDDVATRLNYSVYQNNYLRFDIMNFTTASNDELFLSAEFFAVNNSPSSSNLLVYYCNSSYSSGNPSLNANCELIDSFAANEHLLHKHNFSYHNSIFFKVNSVAKTTRSFILFIGSGNAANAWNFVYIPYQAGYNNYSFKTGDATYTFSNTSNIFDIHLHQYKSNDSFTAKAVYNNGSGTTATSNTIIDWYNITQFPPNAPAITNPTSATKYTIGAERNTTIFFNWTNSSDVNGDTVTFKHLSFYIVPAIKYNVLSITTDLNASYTATNNTVAGNYYINISACDAYACDSSTTQYTFEICRNNYVKSYQACVSGARLIVWSDANSCNEYLDFPSTNGTYEDCTTEITIVTDTNELLLQTTIGVYVFLLICAAWFYGKSDFRFLFILFNGMLFLASLYIAYQSYVMEFPIILSSFALIFSILHVGVALAFALSPRDTD